ncbi:hypothetical protein WBG78_28170 [Chryseolinea sp. T2]|uniref:hypothetical protein n=1 Tax=Chryseolinea sp. T2 TaxID=3129255 RepID=UPI003076C26E
MKNVNIKRPGPGIFGVVGTIIFLFACSDEQISPRRNDQVPFGKELRSESGDFDRIFQGFDRDCKPGGPNYNLNVWLMGDKRGELGFIAFRQKENETQMIHLDTYIRGLEPNTSYILQRAVDTTLDNNCTSATWLTLGLGLDPKPIVTNKFGFGHEELFRSVAAIPVGSTFDIHFQILKETTMEVVLSSDCYQYTVR